jgi:hypothetical protein
MDNSSVVIKGDFHHFISDVAARARKANYVAATPLDGVYSQLRATK